MAKTAKTTNGQERAARSKKNITFDFESISVPMRRAIVKAHELGNTSAITARDAGFCDVPIEDFNLWVFRVNGLREFAVKYGNLVESKNSAQDDIVRAKNELFTLWKAVLKAGEANLAHPNMFVRSEDADTLRVYATGITWLHAESVGSVMATTTPTRFRQMVELLIGCRMAGNALLSDDDRDIIAGWNSACKSEQSAEERLEGNAERNIVGLKKQLDDAEKALETASDMLISAVGEEAAKGIIESNPSFKGMRGKLVELQRQIDASKKAQNDARNWKSIHGVRYREIIATLNRIEYPAVAK